MALGISLEGGPITSSKRYTTVSNARATELIDAFISNWAGPVPEGTALEQAQWKLDQARQKLEDFFVSEAVKGFDIISETEIDTIRQANRDKAKLG